MKLSYLPVGFFSIATLSSLLLLPITPASAQCVMADTNIQIAINGSRRPSDRTNDVSQRSNGPCVGNTISTTNTQIQVGGTERARQYRSSNQEFNGGSGNPTGINIPAVKVPVNVQIDVYNAADRYR